MEEERQTLLRVRFDFGPRGRHFENLDGHWASLLGSQFSRSSRKFGSGSAALHQFSLFIGLGERPTPIDRSGRISHALEAQKARARARTENTPNDAEVRLPGQ